MNFSLIKFKIPIIFAIGILITVIALTSYSAISIRKELINKSKKELQFATGKLAQKIESKIESGLNSINTMKHLIII